MTDVSIIMPVYNGEKFLRETISSVLGQTYRAFELLCIDDGSTDRSEEIIKSFEDTRIKYIYQPNSGSPSSGRNVGIGVSEGKYVAFIDQDDLYEPNSLNEKVSYFERRPETSFVYSNCRIIDEKTNIIANKLVEYTNKVPLSGHCFRELFMGIFIPIQGVMIRKDVFSRLGDFHEDLIGTDDYHMWLRICYYYPIRYIDKCLASWRCHPFNLSKDSKRMDENFAKCLESIIRIFPDCSRIIGRKRFRSRMHQVCFDAAYAKLGTADWRSARNWLGKSLLWGKKSKTLLQFLEALGLESLNDAGFENLISKYRKLRWDW